MGEFSDDDSPDPQKGLLLHASCVSFDGRAVLITGVSGCGKSGLALQLMALGASLVSDDQTEIALRDDFLIARAPVAIRGIIEARGLGILNAETVEQARVVLMIDMDRSEKTGCHLHVLRSFWGILWRYFGKWKRLTLHPQYCNYCVSGDMPKRCLKKISSLRIR
ncbi:HPr kinase/phosphorylase [Pseudopelagicola sp. nBUS_19]